MKKPWLRNGAWLFDFKQVKYTTRFQWVGMTALGAGGLLFGIILLSAVLPYYSEMSWWRFTLVLICPAAALAYGAIWFPMGLVACVRSYKRKKHKREEHLVGRHGSTND